METQKFVLTFYPKNSNIASVNIANKKKCSLLSELSASEIKSEHHFWRYRPDLNWRMKVLQTTSHKSKIACYSSYFRFQHTTLLIYC